MSQSEDGDHLVPVEKPIQSEFVQLIDEKGQFNSTLDEYLRGLGFTGINYHVLAVFGCQSSGKSTLLNKLFDTKFPVMDSSRGRHQTTKGIVASRATKTDIFVLDMEGTDSKERGEANMNFERKTSLFALAMAEVLIINMWVQDIGRYNASNYSLLKTVFELNLQLFANESSGKMLLHFVIRDLVDTPPDTLQQQLLDDVNTLWAGLIKPEAFSQSKPSDFYDFSFFFLPHLRLAGADFDKGIIELRQRFVNTDDENFVFKSNYRKPVPIDGFSMYASSIWETIQANKDLDIPTQKEMLAMYRCADISKELFTTAFLPHLEGEWKEQHAKGLIVKDLGALAENTIAQILKQFSETTALYFPSVVEKMRNDLNFKMRNEIHVLFDAQLQIIRKSAFKAYDVLLQSLIPLSSDRIMTDFCEVTRKLQTSTLEFFTETVRNASLPDEQWDSEPVRRELVEADIFECNSRYRREQIERVLQSEKRAFAAELATCLTPIIEAAPSDMWKHLRSAFQHSLQLEETHLQSSLAGFEPEPHESTALLEEIRASGIDFIRAKIDDVASFFSIKMMKTFNDKFRFTDDHLPIVWKPRDNVKGRFIEARDLALQLLNAFFLFRLEDDSLDSVNLNFTEDVSGFYAPESPVEEDYKSVPGSTLSTKRRTSIGGSGGGVTRFEFPSSKINDEDKVVLNETECRRIFERFLVESDAAFSDAERAQLQNANSTRVPWWVFALLLVFGWNEIMYVLTHPLWLFALLAIGVALALSVLRSQIEDWLRTGPPSLTIPINMVLTRLPVPLFETTRPASAPPPFKSPSSGPTFVGNTGSNLTSSSTGDSVSSSSSIGTSSSSSSTATRLRNKLMKQHTDLTDGAFQERMEETFKGRSNKD